MHTGHNTGLAEGTLALAHCNGHDPGGSGSAALFYEGLTFRMGWVQARGAEALAVMEMHCRFLQGKVAEETMERCNSGWPYPTTSGCSGSHKIVTLQLARVSAETLLRVLCLQVSRWCHRRRNWNCQEGNRPKVGLPGLHRHRKGLQAEQGKDRECHSYQRLTHQECSGQIC